MLMDSSPVAQLHFVFEEPEPHVFISDAHVIPKA